MWGATAKAMQVCIDDPSKALADSAKYVPGLDQADNAAMAMATLKATTPLYQGAGGFGSQDATTWASMADFMAGAGLLDASVNPTDAYTTSVVGWGSILR
ncbi:MAG: hypothetical protein FWD63_04610, partial [Propionibacteriaceae bacterium]|nr:hypothetical protein [Propionibacteriaceae bacterium]